MHVDEKALAKQLPSSRRRDEIARRKNQIQLYQPPVYEAEVVDDPPRVVVLAVEADSSRSRGKHMRLKDPDAVEKQTFAESIAAIDVELSSKNKQRIAAIVAGILMISAMLLGTIIGSPM